MARVLVVDDSRFYQTAVARILVGLGHEVVGSAGTGREGAALARSLRPDLVLMDLVMPDGDGYEATREIMETAPTRILVLSSAAGEGRSATIRALRAGAVDFVLKPDAAHAHELRTDLTTKIEAALHRPVETNHAARTAAAPSASASPIAREGWSVVVVAVSTGGPSTLQTLLAPLPAALAVPVLVAQHMPPVWTRTLAEHLDQECRVQVVEAEDGTRAQPGHVYIAPGGRHLRLDPGGLLALDDSPPRGALRPSADVLFESAARADGRRVLGVVLTGMGSDGLAGAREIRRAGGKVIAQDRWSCVVWGMPRAVEEAGEADWVAPLRGISGLLAELT